MTREIYKRIVDAVAERRLAPGQRVREAALAREFGVSRTPVREALQLLVNDGIVSPTSDGLVVTELTVKQVQDTHKVFLALNTLAARLAAERGTDGQMAELEAAMRDMEHSVVKGDFAHWAAADKLLHEQIFTMADNVPLFRVHRQINPLVNRSHFLANRYPGRMEQSASEHRAVVNAIKAHNPDLAERLMTQHLLKVEAMMTMILEDFVIPLKGVRI